MSIFDSRLQIRLSSEEYVGVKDSARRQGMTVSAYARAKLLDQLADGDTVREGPHERLSELEDQIQDLDKRVGRIEALAEGQGAY